MAMPDEQVDPKRGTRWGLVVLLVLLFPVMVFFCWYVMAHFGWGPG
jgi:hypothetical protein